MANNNLLNNLKIKVEKPLKEGNYELALVTIQEIQNENGGYIKLTFKGTKDDEEITLNHNIFCDLSKDSVKRSLEYHISALAQQLEMYGEDISLGDVLIIGNIYKIYISYNEEGRRNVSFGVRKTKEETADEGCPF